VKEGTVEIGGALYTRTGVRVLQSSDSSSLTARLRSKRDRPQQRVLRRDPPHMTIQWKDDYYLARPSERSEMETALVEKEVNAGRGWNETRKWVIDQFVAQVKPSIAPPRHQLQTVLLRR
jgi:hypothetical protein